ncbi:HD domain-containing protein [bacterium]|nr:HD domain-containing protein [bacterium]
MKRINVNDLANCINQEIDSYFLVVEKDLRQGNKDFFLRLKLADKSGFVVANIWKNATVKSDMFEVGDVLQIKGMVIKYNKNIQITINDIYPLEEKEYDLAELIPASKKDITELTDNFFEYVDSIQNEYLSQLLKAIFDNKQILNLFISSPAAKGWHHNYAGGLLEHTLTVTKICDFACALYPVDRDLTITGAILHDLGKIYEYDSAIGIDFSDEGRLIGHFVLVDQMITEHASKIDLFPKELLMKLRHMVLAHHGEYDKGSVRLPQTLEAHLLHLADNMDAQVTGVKQIIEASSDNSKWSEFDKLNQKFYYKG